MRTMLLSFESNWFDKLENGETKFEYRKMLPSDAVTVYFYVSRPVMAISGIAHFGEREPLSSWLEKYSDRSADVIMRIKDYLADCNYAVPILDFLKTNKIPIKQLYSDLPTFVVPRMYYYLDNTDLLSYLNQNLRPIAPLMTNSFDAILDEEICN
jgi:predicted transcriptional regulator